MTIREDVREYFEREAHRNPASPSLRASALEQARGHAVERRSREWIAGGVAVLLAVAIVAGLLATSARRHKDVAPVPAHASPSQTATAPTLLCFIAPPSDWATAIAKVAATLDGTNFAAGAIDEQAGVVYGGAWMGSRTIIASVSLSTGKMTEIAPMSSSGFGWMSFADGWLVWDEPGVLDFQLWNARTHELRQVATGPQLEGTVYLTSSHDPVIGKGYMVWSQPMSSRSAELRVYELATGHVTILDSGDVGSPVFTGANLVWKKWDAGAANPRFVFADASTLQPVAAPAELRDPRQIGFVAGSAQWLVWTGTPSTSSPDNGTWFVDDLGAGIIRTYTASGHYFQFPQLAGPYLVWFGADKNSIVDLRSGAGIDLPLPGYVEAAGNTIVVERVSGPKGSVNRTDVSVLHASQLSSLGPCKA
ncbi:MAG: hypothetical protein M3082_04035 [Candidatus Dormibacteraeota bacterium]|nr:hypothetical protein [Candidatus Dormibacteraeota bacterium]